MRARLLLAALESACPLLACATPILSLCSMRDSKRSGHFLCLFLFRRNARGAHLYSFSYASSVVLSWDDGASSSCCGDQISLPKKSRFFDWKHDLLDKLLPGRPAEYVKLMILDVISSGAHFPPNNVVAGGSGPQWRFCSTQSTTSTHPFTRTHLPLKRPAKQCSGMFVYSASLLGVTAVGGGLRLRFHLGLKGELFACTLPRLDTLPQSLVTSMEGITIVIECRNGT